VLALRRLTAKGMHLSERQRISQLRSFFKRAERIAAGLTPTVVRWLDAAGNTIRSFTPSSRFAGLALFGPLISGEGESSSSASGSVGISIP
jgi:hypothetical protein